MRTRSQCHASAIHPRRRLGEFFLVVLLALWCLASPGHAARPDPEEVGDVRVVVLNYHKVDNLYNSLAIPPADFDRQMRYLKETGFHVITLAELGAALTEGAALPENPVAITFDDGYSDNYDYAYPILKKYGFRATIFVVTSYLDQSLPGYLTWGQASEMEASGLITIESHTVTHGSMVDLTDEQICHELTESKRDIEQRLGKTAEFLAYPTGTYNLHIASLVKEAGYKGAFTIKYGNVNRDSNLYALERLPVFQTEDTFRSFVERLQYLPIFEQLGWSKS